VEKYGVDTGDEPKEAGERDAVACPACGSALEPADKVNVRKCPKCGTLPYEGTDDGKGE
jgi:ribosomal protein L37AE/L43A